MDYHLVGGFLGSGKTTAIVGAARKLIAQGKVVGIVTNDQGKYLVDTAFFKSAYLPTVEVTGGCFCCNYDDLDARLRELKASALPDVIFAESVGSCADIVATVVKPFLDVNRVDFPLTSFTVFSDARLLRRRLRNQPMPFGDAVVYIFDKQIEEARFLVVNKIDLLSPRDANEVNTLCRVAFPGKVVHLQDSRTPDGVTVWLDMINSDRTLIPSRSVDINYDRYAAGEADLAWLDESISVTAPDGLLRPAIISVVGHIRDGLTATGLSIGHVKFLISASGVETKISLPSLDDAFREDESVIRKARKRQQR